MIYHLLNLLNSLLIGLLFAYILEKIRFPREFNNFFISCSYNIIYIYSKFQIIFIKYNKSLNETIESNLILLKIKNWFTSIINSNKNNVIKLKEDNFGFTIFNKFDLNSGYVNSKIIQDISLLPEDNTEFELSTIQFILIEFIIGENKTFKIELKNKKYNFYIVGNVLTRDFFVYYLKNIQEPSFELNKEEKLTIKILDHQVNMVEFVFTNKNEHIIIEKTGYKLIL